MCIRDSAERLLRSMARSDPVRSSCGRCGAYAVLRIARSISPSAYCEAWLEAIRSAHDADAAERLHSCALLAAYRRALIAKHGARRSGPLMMRTLRSVCSPAHCSQHIAERLMLSMARSDAVRSETGRCGASAILRIAHSISPSAYCSAWLEAMRSVLKPDAAERLQSCALLATYGQALTGRHGSKRSGPF